MLTVDLLTGIISVLIFGGFLDLAYHTIKDIQQGSNGVTWAFLMFEIAMMLSMGRPITEFILHFWGFALDPLLWQTWRLFNFICLFGALLALRVVLHRGNDG